MSEMRRTGGGAFAGGGGFCANRGLADQNGSDRAFDNSSQGQTRPQCSQLWSKHESLPSDTGNQINLPSALPLKFFLNDQTRQKYTFDSPTRTWNGNLWGPREGDQSPNMNCKSNYSIFFRPKDGEAWECECDSWWPSLMSQKIVWNDVCNSWTLHEEASPTQTTGTSALAAVSSNMTETQQVRLREILNRTLKATQQDRLREILKNRTLKATHERLKAELKSSIYDFICSKTFVTSVYDTYKQKLKILVSGAEEGAAAAKAPRTRVVCHEFHYKFQSKVSLNANIEKHLVPASASCLWTALYEAMVHAKIPDMFGQSDFHKVKDNWDKHKIKDQCLGYMLNPVDGEKKSSVVKKEFTNMDFAVFSGDGVTLVDYPFDKYYEDRKKEGSWATPFEVHLAARRFNCIIHLFYFNDSGNGDEYYCFKPDPRRRIPGSKAPQTIFLTYKKLFVTSKEHHCFHFEWFEVIPKVFRANNLFEALQSWLRQDDVRPMTYHQLGRNESEFKLKCSKIFEKAHSQIARFQYDVTKPTEFILKCIAFQFQVDIRICRWSPIFNGTEPLPEINELIGNDDEKENGKRNELDFSIASEMAWPYSISGETSFDDFLQLRELNAFHNKSKAEKMTTLKTELDRLKSEGGRPDEIARTLSEMENLVYHSGNLEVFKLTEQRRRLEDWLEDNIWSPHYSQVLAKIKLVEEDIENRMGLGRDWELPSNDVREPLQNKPVMHVLYLHWDTANQDFVGYCPGLPELKYCTEVKETPSQTLQRLFNYPQGFERFYRVLEESLSAKSKKGHTEVIKAMKLSVYRSFLSDYIRNEQDRLPVHNVFFGDEQKMGLGVKKLGDNERAGSSSKFRPLETLYAWLENHYTTTCLKDCHHGFCKIQDFICRRKGSFEGMCAFMKLICVLGQLSIFNFSDKKPLSHLDKDLCVFDDQIMGYRKICEIIKSSENESCMEVDIDKKIETEKKIEKFLMKHFIVCRDLDSSYCIFQELGSKSMFDLAYADFSFAHTHWPMSLKQFVSMQKNSSTMTARWLRYHSGHTLKVWAHMPKRDYDNCETEKCTDPGQKWRHMIFSYAVMALLWNEFNGNKEGPLGDYPLRSAQCVGQLNPKAHKLSSSPMQVYASKEGGVPVDYVGHNIVALAVGKRGDILRIAYNHNALFSNTVDHAEERLIDGLYRDPRAFIPKGHAQIYNAMGKTEIEKHMQHISVYTSLEPCQQCSGKMQLALVPEVISCQRDWEIKLLGGQLYNQFHKCRAVLASYFDFSPYDDLGKNYKIFCERAVRDKMSFFKSDHRNVDAKPTMPYFLCTDEAHAIFKRGHDVFDKVFRILFHEHQNLRPTFGDWTFKFFREPQREFTVTLQDKVDLLKFFNIDVSQWMTIDTVGDSDKNSDRHANDIRQFRPSLSDKKNRVLQDELMHLRQSWVSNVFKQMCSLTFFCDYNCSIDESLVERNLSPLGDISSINLTRTVEGQLKGMFTVTFSNSDMANDVKFCMDKVLIHEDGEASFPIGFRVDSDGFKRKEYKEACKWLYQIRKPLASELFLPEDAVNRDDIGRVAKRASAKIYFPTSSGDMIRKWPLQVVIKKTQHQAEDNLREGGSRVLVVKCKDIASARRLKSLLPNFDAPNNIRVSLLPQAAQRDRVASVYFSSVTSVTDVHAGTFTLIVRTDVTEGQLLTHLNNCFPQHNCSSLSLRLSSSVLTSCNSLQTIKWLDFASVGKRCYDWKIWTIPFFCAIIDDKNRSESIDPKISILAQMQPNFASLHPRFFCQPYPQSVYDFAVEIQQKHYILHSDFLYRESRRSASSDHSEPSNLGGRAEGEFFILNVVKISKESEESTKDVFILVNWSSASKVASVCIAEEAIRSKYPRIEICESSLVTLLISYMLVDSRQEVAAFLLFAIKKQQVLDFWGQNLQICTPIDFFSSRQIIYQFREIVIDSLLNIRNQNLLEFYMLCNGQSRRYLDFTTKPESFFCEFCGLFSDFPVLIDIYTYTRMDKICCVAHTKGSDRILFVEPQMEKVKVTPYKIKSLWDKPNEIENELDELYIDPAKELHPRKSIEAIRQKENALQLELRVDNKVFQPHRVDHESCIVTVSFLLRRDDVFGSAHILFSLLEPCHKKEELWFRISDSQSLTSVSRPHKIEIIKRIDLGKGLEQIYGRLEHSKQKGFSEGGEIPACDLRKFLEPEYFPELFFIDELEAFPFYPTLDFLERCKFSDSGKGKGCKKVFVSLHSWDFSEFQTPELSHLLMCRRQLHAVEFDQMKNCAELQKKHELIEASQNEANPSYVYKRTVMTNHDIYKECLQFLYCTEKKNNAGPQWVSLTIPSQFKSGLFDFSLSALLDLEQELVKSDDFISLADDLVLKPSLRQAIAGFLNSEWPKSNFNLESLVKFVINNNLYWSKYESLLLEVSLQGSDRQRPSDEDAPYRLFMNLIGINLASVGDAAKASIKQCLAQQKHQVNLSQLISLIESLGLSWKNLKQAKLTVITANLKEAAANAAAKVFLERFIDGPQSSNEADIRYFDIDIRSFMDFIGISDSTVVNDAAKASIEQFVLAQQKRQLHLSELISLIESLKSQIEPNEQPKKRWGQFYDARTAAENAKDAKADATAVFLNLIGYPALLSPVNKREIKKTWGASSRKVGDLVKTYLPYSLKLVFGYFARVPDFSTLHSISELKDAFGDNTMNIGLKDMKKKKEKKNVAFFPQQDLVVELRSICKNVETYFTSSKLTVVEEEANCDIHADHKTYIHVSRLNRMLSIHEAQHKKVTNDYNEALSKCLRLFHNHPSPEKRKAGAENRVDVTFQIIHSQNSLCCQPLKRESVSEEVPISTCLGREYISARFFYDGNVVSSANSLREISYDPSKTIFVSAAGEEGGGGEAEALRGEGARGKTAGSARGEELVAKLTIQTLQAMSAKQVAETATARAGITDIECVQAVTLSEVSGATYQKDWIRDILEARLRGVAYFGPASENDEIDVLLGKIIDAMLAMKAEADSAKDYSKMLETFKFFLQKDSQGSRKVSRVLARDCDESVLQHLVAPSQVLTDMLRSVRSERSQCVFEQASSPHIITFFLLLRSITRTCDPVLWILDTGKELERACDFAMALKYYFAGRMFFARLNRHQPLQHLPATFLQVKRNWKRLKYEEEFKDRYNGLLPMTNAQAYSDARESVHYQNVVLKRGTMNK